MRSSRIFLSGLALLLGASLTAQLRLPAESDFPLLFGGAAAGPMGSWRSGGGERIASFGEQPGRFVTSGWNHGVVPGEQRVVLSFTGQGTIGQRWNGRGADESGWSSSLLQPSAAPAAAPRPFDFTRTAPHLAFFCRLEINEKAGGIIPAKFRLGGHRYWQDNLLRE